MKDEEKKKKFCIYNPRLLALLTKVRRCKRQCMVEGLTPLGSQHGDN